MDAKSPVAADNHLARRCVVDISLAIENYPKIDGISRVEIETARALLAAGGQVIWIDATTGRPYKINRTTFSVLFDKGAVRPILRWLLSIGTNSVEDIIKRELRLLRLRRRRYSPRDDDVLLLFGAYWLRPALATVSKIARRHPTLNLTLIHDLIPLRRPDVVTNAREYSRIFREYLRTMLTLCDRMLANSQFTKADLLRFCDEEGLPAPPISVLPLASDLDARNVSKLTPRLAKMKIGERPFALMVSTIEVRKNHVFAYQLWRRLAERLGSQNIPLVLAGSRGWLANDLLTRMENDSQMWGRHLLFVDRPSEEELAWLYAHARFTIFPSEIEGWGLPITESLSFGTYCLAADNSSLREASQGLAWHADTLDGRAWLEEAERCILDPLYLDAKRSEIAARFLKRRWSDFLADTLRAVEATAETLAAASNTSHPGR